MPALLTIETATPVCSVALRTPAGVTERRGEGTGIHSESVFRYVQVLLESAGMSVKDLDGVVLSAGPGSYTGLRIGAAAVKGLLFGSDTPVYLADTLLGMRLLAESRYPGRRVHSVIDARRTHLYHSTNGTASHLAEIGAVAGQIRRGDIVVGTGIERLPADTKAEILAIGTEGVSAYGPLLVFDLGRARSTCADAIESLYFSAPPA